MWGRRFLLLSLDDWHLVFASVCLVLVLAVCSPLVLAYLPSRDEPFFALAVLGEEGMAEHYYPDDDPQIEVGEEVNWTLYLYNHMGKAQYVAVRVKFLNSTMLAPNSTSVSPSPAPVVFEVRRVLLDNETWLFPFFWAVLDVEQIDDFLEIRSLYLNDEVIDTHTIAMQGYSFRVIFELWVYDKDFEDLRFGWVNGDEMRCTWNQIWFNVA